MAGDVTFTVLLGSSTPEIESTYTSQRSSPSPSTAMITKAIAIIKIARATRGREEVVIIGAREYLALSGRNTCNGD